MPAKPAKKAAQPVKKAGKPAAAPAKKGAAPVKKGGDKPQGKKKAPVKLYETRQQDFTIGNDLPPRRDLSRMVRWPKYIRLQRQKAILYKRLTVPPSINQFTHTTDKNTSTTLFRLLNKYRPEDHAQKKARLRATAKGGEEAAAHAKKPLFVKYGINHVVALIEAKKAKLVVVAHDVDPIELVVYIPALCRKLDIPYLIVKGKARLGQVVHKKTATALVVADVRKEDQADLAQLVSFARDNFNNNVDVRRTWGGQILGHKSQKAQDKVRKAIAREAKRKAAIGAKVNKATADAAVEEK